MADLIKWDVSGERMFELGVDHVVLYPLNETKAKSSNSADVKTQYGPGVAWNGITSISESPEGGDANDLWADNIKYASLRATETFGASIEAYMYPDEFAVLDGSASLADGVYAGQQKRGKFGLCYRTRVGDDTKDEAGYKYHLIYGCSVTPSEKSYETVNDSPDAITFSWDMDTTPVTIDLPDGAPEALKSLKPTSVVIIDSTKLDGGENNAKLKTLLSKLYGTAAVAAVPASGNNPAVAAVAAVDAYLPLPGEVFEIMYTAPAQQGSGG